MRKSSEKQILRCAQDDKRCAEDDSGFRLELRRQALIVLS